MKEIDGSKIKILVCCHKKCELPQDDIFLPIHVGAAISSEDLGMQRDDQVNGQPCDNISAKNKNYCELTAMYWAWKNIRKLYPDIEYIGLNHYRRFFDFDGRENSVRASALVSDYKINKKKLGIIMKKGRVVLLKSSSLPYSVSFDYQRRHLKSDYDCLKTIMEDFFPGYYRAFIHFFELNNMISYCNMFIMKISEYETYCEWLFSVLDRLENVVNLTERDDYQRRVFGFVAERLFNVFIYKNHSKCSFLPTIMYQDIMKKNYWLTNLYHNFLDFIIFRLYLLRFATFRTRISMLLYSLGIRK